MEALAIILYVLLAGAVIFFSVKLSDYVDLLDKKTKISGAFLGGILLAAITSLPELFTSLTATVILPVPDNHYVLGNILGSNAFNLILFVIIFGIFFKKMVDSKVSKGNLVTILITTVLYIITTLASLIFDGKGLLWGWFNPLSLAVVAVYIVSILVTPKEEESENKETDSQLTVKQIIIRFIIFSILLIAASIGVTYVVDWVASLFNIGATIGGALFLGIATSLPELTSTFNLCRKKNFNAAYGNILGSGVFNFFILAIADALSFRCVDASGNFIGIYKMDQSAFLLILSAIIAMIIAVIGLLIHCSGKVKANVCWRILYLVFSIIILGSYIAAIVLSAVPLNIPFAPIA